MNVRKELILRIKNLLRMPASIPDQHGPDALSETDPEDGPVPGGVPRSDVGCPICNTPAVRDNRRGVSPVFSEVKAAQQMPPGIRIQLPV